MLWSKTMLTPLYVRCLDACCAPPNRVMITVPFGAMATEGHVACGGSTTPMRSQRPAAGAWLT